MNEEFMQIALDCAKSVKGNVSPNPAVGAVVIKNGQVVGKGATSPVGGNHAEINAINQAGELCGGSDLFVSLEPCCHFGRTPPCVDAIIKSKFKQVFISCLDPNPLVAGKGVQKLRESGIDVNIGLCETEAKRINEDFFWFIQNRKPFVSVKLAMTLDNKISDVHGKSQWITNEKSLKYAHFLRSISSAVAVGKNTLIADNPKLNVRNIENSKNPVRIVFSSNADVGENSFFRENAKNHRSIIVLNSKEKYIEKNKDGVEIWATGESDYKNSFLSFLETAGKELIDSLLIEGGSRLVETAMDCKSVNRFYLFYAPKILGGGREGLILNNSPLSIDFPIKLNEIELQNFDGDILISGLAKFTQ
ncbi:MAG: bifunctional diaminohydroxyphosphoribosylaminopyrimidine deaminase/5-amino-6-(5-phosphoribosylamino)uracil reductase RibD [Chitinispirillales bacterium]|jgi:diaminohydroxyphosphoribosylaminopyrimidine deaminase/5-amino-6-(5-phosphoribosylamino)uracil reductase|nr:bifunctional diaminohydroxyphosphoribosylaminopyrimidine deaminase/5-amino-6-(5-phosphoribosylamino)uracil reductase RibD [Chitinispirillales bacterium]